MKFHFSPGKEKCDMKPREMAVKLFSTVLLCATLHLSSNFLCNTKYFYFFFGSIVQYNIAPS